MFKLKIDTLYSYINTLKLLFCKNKHDDPIFSLAKMIAEIILYVISKAGTLSNFGTFLIWVFLGIKICENIEKILNNTICYKIYVKTYTSIFA